MNDIINKFKVTDGKSFSLKDYATSETCGLKKEDTDAVLPDLIKHTSDLQSALYAGNRQAVLILFQAMDAAGKDGAIAHTLSGLNPQGCEVFSFKQPSTEELSHDFLWRHYKALPEFGRIGVHNRSYYENVLIAKVHPELLLREKLAGTEELGKLDKKFWDSRYQSIRSLERHFSNNGTVIIKFFLNLSKEEQRLRFLKRIEDPQKNWKFSGADIQEREFWDDYMDAYENAIRETATDVCPWYVIPADKKWFTRIAISTIILDMLKSLDLSYPVLPQQQQERLLQAIRMLENN